jgi:protein-S-isoprenylcysteine O-methyltransferase Ste14
MATKIAILTRRPILSGLIYGDVIYLVMNFVILPVSSVPHPKSTTTIAALVNGVLALMQCIGLPISVLTARYLPAHDRG